MSTSLRLRLSIGISVVVAIVLTVLGLVVLRATRADQELAVAKKLERSVQSRLSVPSADDVSVLDSDPRERSTAHLSVARSGDVIAGEPAGPPSDPLPLPTATPREFELLRAGQTLTLDASGTAPRYMLVGRVDANGILEVEAASLGELDQMMHTLTWRYIVGALITLAVTVGVVIAVLRQSLKPLRGVIEAANQVAAGGRELTIPTNEGPTEIRQLLVSLEHVLRQQRSLVQVAEESDLKLRRYLIDASHELQAPITSVLGWTELIQRNAVQGDGILDALGRVSAEGRRMSLLVDELSQLARLDEGRPLIQQPVDFTRLAREAIADAAATHPDRVVHADLEESIIVHGDPDRLRQVLVNLLTNVWTHTQPTVAAHVTLRAEGSQMLLRVDDRGPGFDPKHLEEVFLRFWRGDSTRTRPGGGSGLGLSIVAAIVQAHQGSVSAANRPGGGASISVKLPLIATRLVT